MVARKAEDFGFSVLSMGDHLSTNLASLTALATAAAVTTTLRVGSLVFANDFRHPAMLAKEMATLDLLSDGRLELGLGTGWMQNDYDGMGLSLDRPGVRISRLEEAIQIIKGLFGSEPVTFNGQHYTLTGLNGLPKPVQQPRPPILIGGGGRRMLSLAAREADIVSIDSTNKKGNVDFSSVTVEAYDQKVRWVRQAAGTRYSDLELNTLIWRVAITDDREQAVQQLLEEYNIDLGEVSVAQFLESPKLLMGTEDEIVEMLQARRERYGISYFTIMGEHHLDICQPILARLVGT